MPFFLHDTIHGLSLLLSPHIIQTNFAEQMLMLNDNNDNGTSLMWCKHYILHSYLCLPDQS